MHVRMGHLCAVRVTRAARAEAQAYPHSRAGTEWQGRIRHCGTCRSGGWQQVSPGAQCDTKLAPRSRSGGRPNGTSHSEVAVPQHRVAKTGITVRKVCRHHARPGRTALVVT
eukprot:scaffold30032_cov138-Isochrysis_galbana.AAC.4